MPFKKTFFIHGPNGRRRRFLRNIVTTSASLPFLSYMPSLGAQENPRKRLILMFSPNGTIPDQHFPSGGETGFQLKRILEPLTSIREELLIFKGLENKTGSPGDGHQRGMGGLWTADNLTPGSTLGGCSTCEPVDWAGGPSIDQVIANHIGQDTRFKSLEYGFRCGSPNVWTRMCYTGRNAPLEPEQDPYKAFDRLYKNFDPVNEQCTSDSPRNQRLRFSLDAAVADFQRARPYLSQADKIKLEQHTDTLRDLLRALEATTSTCDVDCDIPQQGDPININNYSNMVILGRLFMDLMISAFACDLTAVASMQWTRSVGGASYPHLNISENHHAMSHIDDSDTAVKNKLTNINRWYAEQFLYLIEKLKTTPDPAGGGTLLDNSFVLWGNELGKGNSHTRRDIPFVSAGNVQGYFRTGRYIRQDGQLSHARLMTSMLNAFGIPATGFGRFNEGPLANLR